MTTYHDTMTEPLAVVIVGGGPAGLSAGIRLCQLGYEPMIVDRPRPSADRKIGESLAPSAWAVIQKLGIGQIFTESPHLPCPGHQSSWGYDGQLISKDFLFDPYGHGWHLDRIQFEKDLRIHAESAGCRFLDQTVHRFKHSETGGWQFWVDDLPEPVQARFLIDATGRSSMIAHAAGARKQKEDQLVAWYGFLEPTSAAFKDARGLIEARPEGWWYSALLPDGCVAAVFLTDPDLLPVRELHSSGTWEDWLDKSDHTRRRIRDSGYRLKGSPKVAPAGSAILDTLHGNDWVACGDAAASYDPLSSHGIATGLATGLDAAQAFHDMSTALPQTMEQYRNRVHQSFELYKTLRNEFYRQEDRWPDLPFWQRRNGQPDQQK